MGMGTQLLGSRIWILVHAPRRPQFTPAGPAARCQDFQNPTALALLRRRWWYLACIFYGSGDITSTKQKFEFLRMCRAAALKIPAVSKDFQNPTAQAPLGRHSSQQQQQSLFAMRKIIHVYINVKDHTCHVMGLGTRSRVFSFGACAPRHRRQLNPATFTHSGPLLCGCNALNKFDVDFYFPMNVTYYQWEKAR